MINIVEEYIHLDLNRVEILRQIHQVSEVYARRLTTLSSEVTK